MKISVCMATYNGEKYIEKQLQSILDQLDENDEIIIVDDYSNDNTVDCIKVVQDKRIILLENELNIGVNASFEKALKVATGDIIFLSDQDDIWFENKVQKIVELFNKNHVDLIQHDANIVDENMDVIHDSFFELRNANQGVIKNYISNTYLGCSMSFRRKILERCLPIPKHSGYHDRWIGVIAELEGFKVLFHREKLMYYIRHGGTGSNLIRRDLWTIFFDRIDFLRAIIIFIFKKLVNK